MRNVQILAQKYKKTQVSQVCLRLFRGNLSLNEGDSASSYRHWRNGVPHTGEKGEEDGRRSWNFRQRQLFPRRPSSSPWSHTEVRTIPPRTQWASGISNGKSRKHANRCNKKSLRNLNKKIKHPETISRFCYVKGSFGSSTSSRPSRSWLSLSLWKSGSIRSGKVYSSKASGNL